VGRRFYDLNLDATGKTFASRAAAAGGGGVVSRGRSRGHEGRSRGGAAGGNDAFAAMMGNMMRSMGSGAGVGKG
jgi:hypothetical protein